MRGDLINVRIVRPGALPALVEGQRNRWRVYLIPYGKTPHLALFAECLTASKRLDFVEGREGAASAAVRDGFPVRLNSVKFKIMAALCGKGIALFCPLRAEAADPWHPKRVASEWDNGSGRS